MPNTLLNFIVNWKAKKLHQLQNAKRENRRITLIEAKARRPEKNADKDLRGIQIGKENNRGEIREGFSDCGRSFQLICINGQNDYVI